MKSCYNCANIFFCKGEDMVYTNRGKNCPNYTSMFLEKNYSNKKETSKMDNVDKHLLICEELNKLYEKKNHDYGDSFHNTFEEEGFSMARIRLTDKLERFKNLSRNKEDHKGEVMDESIRDTLIDLANYAIMTIMEIDK